MLPLYFTSIQKIRHETFVHPSFAGVRERLHSVLLAVQFHLSVYETPFTENVRRAWDDIIVYGEHAPTVSWLTHGVRSTFDEIHPELGLFWVHLPADKIDRRRPGYVSASEGLVRVLIEGARKRGPRATTLLLSTGLSSVAFNAKAMEKSASDGARYYVVHLARA